jgi:hypothetical protein
MLHKTFSGFCYVLGSQESVSDCGGSSADYLVSVVAFRAPESTQDKFNINSTPGFAGDEPRSGRRLASSRAHLAREQHGSQDSAALADVKGGLPGLVQKLHLPSAFCWRLRVMHFTDNILRVGANDHFNGPVVTKYQAPPHSKVGKAPVRPGLF